MGTVDSHKKKLISHPPTSSSVPRRRKGGIRTMPFIIVNESLERVSSLGILPNMIFYLINDYHMEAATATIVISLWSAMSSALSLFGAFLSDSYLGRFNVITIGSFSNLLGTTLLWLTAMIPQLKPQPSDTPTAVHLAILFSSFILMSIGAGCVRPCSIAFGADQMVNKDDSAEENERVLQSFFNWYYASVGISTLLAVTVIVYVQDHLGWKIGFGIPAILMVFSALAFLTGSSLFIKVEANQSLFTGFLQVFVVALKRRNISLPLTNNTNDYFHGSCEPQLIAPTETLRFLNKACVIINPERELNPNGSASSAWELCTVDQVESFKALLRVIPIWSSGFMVVVCTSQGSFATLQANTMDRHITSNFEFPAGSANVALVVTLTIWIVFYERVMVPLLARFTGRQHGLSPMVRMGIGLLFSSLAMAAAAVTETARRAVATEQGLEGGGTAVVKMSALWLAPTYCFLGLAEAFSAIAMIEFFYTEFPKSMASVAVALYSFGMAISGLLASLLVDVVDSITAKGGRESWLSSDLNEGHLDYYYWLITFFTLVNFVYFLLCSRAYRPPGDEATTPSAAVNEDESGCYQSLPSA